MIGSKRKVMKIDVSKIQPNPAQPRREFNDRELQSLAKSIKLNGLLQPITVRRMEEGFELISGERRLRACKLAGLAEVDCILTDCTSRQSAVLAMTENLQRQNLQIFEEAEGLRRLIAEWGVTQEEAAARLGKSQSSLANKLRLLSLEDDEREKISTAGLTERHARALLRLPDKQTRCKVLKEIVERGMNVRQTDDYIERILSQRDSAKPKRTIVVKDIRIFMNTIRHAVDTMRQSGIAATALNSETEDYYEYVVRIPKHGKAESHARSAM